jgi:hypothetical protein
MDKLTIDFLDLQENFLFNTMGIGVGITQMEKHSLFEKYGMKVTSQKDPIFYGK